VKLSILSLLFLALIGLEVSSKRTFPLGFATSSEPREIGPYQLDPVEPIWVDDELMSRYLNEPVVKRATLESKEEDVPDMDSKSPFTVNGMTIEDHEELISISNKLDFSEEGEARRELYNTTSQSNVCHDCIDELFKWCPTSNYQQGYCCSPNEVCPRATACSDEFDFSEISYMLCPNELGCLFSRTLVPPTSGAKKTYEQIEGKFQLGDLCSYKIAIPSSTDLNDMMYITIEYLSNARAYLIKGNNLLDPIALYPDIKPGQTFSATKDVNFFLMLNR